jgi:uncharacterized membrane protein YhaH (DUF805 family)
LDELEMDWLRLFFSFRGRLDRAGYWTVSLTWFGLALVAAVVWPGSGMSGLLFGGTDPVGVPAVLAAVPALVSSLAVCVRRLHDRGKSGWWMAVFVICPLLEALASLTNIVASVSVPLMILSIAIGVWAFIELACLPGSAGANRYGPAPLAAAD